MADDIGVNPSASYTVGADVIGTVAYQRVKIQQGADGTAVDVTPTNPFPIAVAGVTVATSTPGAADAGVVVWNANGVISATTGTPDAAATGAIVWLVQGQTVNVDLDPYETTAPPAVNSTGVVVRQVGFNVTTASPAVAATGVVVWNADVDNTTAKPASNAAGQIVWVVDGASVTVQQGASVSAQVSGTITISNQPNSVTQVGAGVTGEIVWLAASQTLQSIATLGTIVTVLGTQTVVVVPGASMAVTTNMLTTGAPAAAATGMVVWMVNPASVSVSLSVAAQPAAFQTNVMIMVSSTQAIAGTTMLMTVYQGTSQVAAGTSAWVIPGGKTFRIVAMNIGVAVSVTTTPVRINAFMLQSTATPTWTSAVPIVAMIGAGATNVTLSPQGWNIGGLYQDVAAGVTVGIAASATTATASMPWLAVQGFLFP